MRITDFDLYRDLLKEKSGLVLTPDKSYVLDSRLNPVAKKWGFSSLEAMTAALQGVPDSDLVTDVTEAMTTGETSFFRNTRPFHFFRDTVLPYMLKNRSSKRQIKIWCAACSSGQEPYSLGMILKEMDKKLAGWKIEILATDISNEVLNQARGGTYSQFEVQRGLPIGMLLKHFTQKEEKWQIKDDIRKMVKFQYFNMLDNMSSLGEFDVIFCRNVLVYFDDAGKKQALDKIAGRLRPDGFLFLGANENLSHLTDTFRPSPDKVGIYAHAASPHLLKSSSQALA